MSRSETPIQNLERDLLVRCARVQLRDEDREAIRVLVEAGPDWTKVRDLAHRHYMLTLLYHNLVQAEAAVPEEVNRVLALRARSLGLYNLNLARELVEVIQALAESNIPALPFKGVAIAVRAYGGLALRQVGDLDIVIPPNCVEEATEVVMDRDYALPSQLGDLQDRPYLQFDRFLESRLHQNSYGFYRARDRVHLDLQWSFASRHFNFPVQFETLWSRRRRVDVCGVEVPVFGREDELVLLCTHGGKHGWGQLRWICDIAEILRQQRDLDWEVVFARAETWGGQRMLHIGLLLAHYVLDAVLPETVKRRAEADQTARHLARQAGAGWEMGAMDDLARYRFILRARERWSDKLRYLAGISFTPTAEDWAILHLPRSLSFLYHIIRPIRLIARRGGPVE